MDYLLPCHPSVASTDPLGLCDDDHGPVTLWDVVKACLDAGTDISQLGQLIEDLSYSAHMHGSQDTRFLRQLLLRRYPDPHSPAATSVFHRIRTSALHLPILFPTGSIPHLSPAHPTLHLRATDQIRSLLAHQILNTLTPPLGNTWGCSFSCWYSEPQPLPTAVSGYLSTIFDYFELPVDLDASDIVQYHYLTDMSREIPSWTHTSMHTALHHLRLEPTTAETVPFPHPHIPCTLVASNKEPGFGAACTQEELVTAACPPLLILGALLVCPPVPVCAALLVSGDNMPLAQWTGQGRNAAPLPFSPPNLTNITMAPHTFLLLDASELDVETINADDSSSSGLLPSCPLDLNPTHLLRDLLKCHVGFSALRSRGVTEIAAPLWGAGAFGGEPIIKSLILGVAASVFDGNGGTGGVAVHLAVDTKRRCEGADGRRVVDVLRDLQERYRDSNVTVDEYFRSLYV